MVYLAILILMITQTEYSPLYIYICHLREWEVLVGQANAYPELFFQKF